MNYYNEINPFAARWLRGLIEGGHIPPGLVDERDIRDVGADDLAGYEQVHLFAGIGGWPLALALAGWSGPVWTASCPCPIVSGAKGSKYHCPVCDATDPIWLPDRTGWAACGACGGLWDVDQQHLWPEVWRLVRELRPAVIFGEQVAEQQSAPWWSVVQCSMEMVDYACGSAVLPASGVGAHHRRDRRFFVCVDNADRQERGRRRKQLPAESGEAGVAHAATGDSAQGDHEHEGQDADPGGEGDAVVHPAEEGPLRQAGGDVRERVSAEAGFPDWRDVVYVECEDRNGSKFRPLPASEPVIHPLAYGLPSSLGKSMPALQRLAGVAGTDPKGIGRARRHRVGALQGYGNAIVPQVAAEFVRAAMGGGQNDLP